MNFVDSKEQVPEYAYFTLEWNAKSGTYFDKLPQAELDSRGYTAPQARQHFWQENQSMVLEELQKHLVSIRKVWSNLPKETHLAENGLRQQTHNPKVRHEQKAYHKTETSRLLCRPKTAVEAHQASFS